MSRWAIVDGNSGRLCVLPVGPLTDEKIKYGREIRKEFECRGILEAINFLHEFEKEVSTP